jgi:hypothetical protein
MKRVSGVGLGALAFLALLVVGVAVAGPPGRLILRSETALGRLFGFRSCGKVSWSAFSEDRSPDEFAVARRRPAAATR